MAFRSKSVFLRPVEHGDCTGVNGEHINYSRNYITVRCKNIKKVSCF